MSKGSSNKAVTGLFARLAEKGRALGDSQDLGDCCGMPQFIFVRQLRLRTGCDPKTRAETENPGSSDPR
jgi:hypothetical protein